jgi:UPF0716 protein FxsA
VLPALFALLLVVPLAELWVILRSAERIGVLPTLALLLLVSAAGAWLLKQQGLAAWNRLQDTLRRGHMPAREVVDGALILLGGALLLTPGFLTDAVGLLLLLPPTRAATKGLARRAMARWARRRWGVGAVSAAGQPTTTHTTTRGPDAPSRRRRLPAPPSGPEGRDGDGSRGRG